MSNDDIYNTPQTNLGKEVPEVQSGLFNFDGRLSVLGYMARSIILTVLAAAVAGIAAFLMQKLGLETNADANNIGLAAGVIGFLIIIPFFWIAIALLAKRLHDLNMSGWFGLLALIPILGAVFMMFVGLKPGNKKSNRYGARNPAVGWEKPVGVIGLVLMVGTLLVFIATLVMGFVG